MGVNVVSSGLLSYEALEDLEEERYLIIMDENGYRSFWLDSPGCDVGGAWVGSITYESNIGVASYDWGEINSHYYYLRPFIEILKTNIPSQT